MLKIHSYSVSMLVTSIKQSSRRIENELLYLTVCLIELCTTPCRNSVNPNGIVYRLIIDNVFNSEPITQQGYQVHLRVINNFHYSRYSPDFRHFSKACLAVRNSGFLSKGCDSSWVYVKQVRFVSAALIRPKFRLETLGIIFPITDMVAVCSYSCNDNYEEITR